MNYQFAVFSRVKKQLPYLLDSPAQLVALLSPLHTFSLSSDQQNQLNSLTYPALSKMLQAVHVTQTVEQVLSAQTILEYQNYINSMGSMPIKSQVALSSIVPKARGIQQAKPMPSFKTAKELMVLKDNKEKPQSKAHTDGSSLRKKFVPPFKKESESLVKQNTHKQTSDRLKNVDQALVESIQSQILDSGPAVLWADIAGLDFAKKTIHQAIVWPIQRPDIFTGLRAPPKGLLLFGPPGTGKTLIGKAIASQSGSTFFNISASSLTSKWVGQAQKLVKTLFVLASERQPSVIFIDQVDSLLCARSQSQQQSSRRIKTQFLVQLDGARSLSNTRILIIGATNRPQQLDEAVRRRFTKRIYIPLPDKKGRRQLLESHNLDNIQLSSQEIQQLVQLTRGYSGADLRNLCAQAVMQPLRGVQDINKLQIGQIGKACMKDFRKALNGVKKTVIESQLLDYEKWNQQFGSFQYIKQE